MTWLSTLLFITLGNYLGTRRALTKHPITSSACTIKSGGTGRQCLGGFQIDDPLELDRQVGRLLAFEYP
jgi:hypothetical protein